MSEVLTTAAVLLSVLGVQTTWGVTAETLQQRKEAKQSAAAAAARAARTGLVW